MSTLAPLPEYQVPMFRGQPPLTREWYLWFKAVDTLLRANQDNPFLASLLSGILTLTDGVTAPTAAVGFASVYVDTADGDLKVKFGDAFSAVIKADS